jgi:hypothetical protein
MDFSFSFKKLKPGGSAKPEPGAAEIQFDALRGCGISVRPKVKLAQIIEGQEPTSFDGDPYRHLLCLMGSYDKQGQPWSDDVLFFGSDCITEDGDYTQVLTSLRRLAKDRLQIQDIRDTLDHSTGHATVAFTLDGEEVAWTVDQKDHAFNMSVLSGVAAILQERGDGYRFAFTSIDEQHWIIVCVTEEEFNDLNQTTGIEWAWVG